MAIFSSKEIKEFDSYLLTERELENCISKLRDLKEGDRRNVAIEDAILSLDIRIGQMERNLNHKVMRTCSDWDITCKTYVHNLISYDHTKRGI